MNEENINHFHNNPQNEIDLAMIFQILKRNIWILSFTTLIGLLIGYCFALRITPQYESSGLIQVNDALSNNSVLSGLSNFTG